MYFCESKAAFLVHRTLNSNFQTAGSIELIGAPPLGLKGDDVNVNCALSQNRNIDTRPQFSSEWQYYSHSVLIPPTLTNIISPLTPQMQTPNNPLNFISAMNKQPKGLPCWPFNTPLNSTQPVSILRSTRVLISKLTNALVQIQKVCGARIETWNGTSAKIAIREVEVD